jgi:hypothetical protein
MLHGPLVTYDRDRALLERRRSYDDCRGYRRMDARAPAYRLHPNPRGEPEDVNPAFPAPRSWWMRNMDAWQKIHMSSCTWRWPPTVGSPAHSRSLPL